MQANDWTWVIALGDCAIFQTDFICKAFISAPRIAEPKNIERIQECVGLLASTALEHEGKHTRRPFEIALPKFMAGMAFKRWVQHTIDSWVAFQPMRNL